MGCGFCDQGQHSKYLTFLLKEEFGLEAHYCPFCGSDLRLTAWLNDMHAAVYEAYRKLTQPVEEEVVEECTDPENPYYTPTPEEYLASISIKRDREILTKMKEKENGI